MNTEFGAGVNPLGLLEWNNQEDSASQSKRVIRGKKERCLGLLSDARKLGSAQTGLEGQAKQIAGLSPFRLNADQPFAVLSSQLDHLRSSLDSSTLSFTPLAPKPKASKPERNFTQDYLRSHAYESIGTARAIAGTFHLANEAIAYPFQKAGELVVATCNINDTTKMVCHQAKEGVKDALRPTVRTLKDVSEKTGLTTAVRKIHEAATKKPVGLIAAYENLGIPSAVTEQYHRDVTSILGETTLMLSTAYVGKGLCTFGRGLRDVNQMMRASELAAARLPIIVAENSSLPRHISPYEISTWSGQGTGLVNPANARRALEMPHVERVLEKVNSVLRQQPSSQQMARTIHVSERSLESVLPSFGSAPEFFKRFEIYENVARRSFPRQQLGPMQVQTLKSAGDEYVFRLNFNNRSIVVKDSISPRRITQELVGLNKLHAMGLEHMTVPEIFAAGKYSLGDTRRFTLLKEYVHGPTYEEGMATIGKTALGSAERLHLVNLFDRSCFNAGRAIGELEKKFIYSVVPERDVAHSLAFRLDHTISTLMKENLTSHELGLIHNFNPRSIIDRFLLNPGKRTIVLDKHGPNFVSAGEKMAVIDVENVPHALTVASDPLALSAVESSLFRHRVFELEGLLDGITRQEINRFQNTFSRAVISQSPQVVPREAERFASIFARGEVVRELGFYRANGFPVTSEQIEEAIRLFNREVVRSWE